jgi:predicted transcriptional regulator
MANNKYPAEIAIALVKQDRKSRLPMTIVCLKRGWKFPIIKKSIVSRISTMGKCKTNGWNLPINKGRAAS